MTCPIRLFPDEAAPEGAQPGVITDLGNDLPDVMAWCCVRLDTCLSEIKSRGDVPELLIERISAVYLAADEYRRKITADNLDVPAC